MIRRQYEDRDRDLQETKELLGDSKQREPLGDPVGSLSTHEESARRTVMQSRYILKSDGSG